ncbi:MAG: DNA double-strand break repair nuclease NurA [Methanolinea sp.]|nr:DNA double-strand break repair nuclease NurA [Methanolinea sp.]
MTGDAYRESISRIAHRVREAIPREMGRKFGEHAGLSRSDFSPVPPVPPVPVSAVDGSNAMVLESGSMAIAAVRAGYSAFHGERRLSVALTPVLLQEVGPLGAAAEFSALYTECFGVAPHSPLQVDDASRAASAVRDTLEYWVAHVCAERMPAGGLLLLDGSLRVSEESHDSVLLALIRECEARGVFLGAVAKRTAATWGGGFPLLPAARALARDLGLRGPWWLRIDEEVLDRTRFAQWEHGDIYVCSLNAARSAVLKVELPRRTNEDRAGETFARMAGYTGDARLEGYPHPLIDVHRNVVISQDVLSKIRSDLMDHCAGEGLTEQDIQGLFGDYHDTFGRY